MNVFIESHQIELTDALRDRIHKKIDQMKKRCTDATDIIVRVAGRRKNGWAQSIQVDLRVKGVVLATRHYLSRALGDFYITIGQAFDAIQRQFEHHASKCLDKSHKRQRAIVLKNKILARA